MVRLPSLISVQEYSKLETNEFKLSQKLFPLRPFIFGITSLFKMQAAAKGLNFIITIPECAPAQIYQDEVKLGQVFVNILSNAIKYT